jgi:hypothetical protein
MKSYSQSGQDLWAFKESGYKKDGFYIEIGTHRPVYLSNTFALEQKGWKGISFEIEDIQGIWSKKRKTKLVICDATKFNFLDCFIANEVPKNIDYLSLDIDQHSLACLRILPLDTYEFNSITIEHDEYIRGSEIKKSMREILFSHGYKLSCPDVSNNNCVYEDWWTKK